MERNLRQILLSKMAPGPGDCMDWTGKLDKNGYGKLDIYGKCMRVPRLVYAEFCGPIQEGMCICHKCDRPKCCNPKHLFAGTRSDNTRDMVKKLRSAQQKLKPQNVRFIRENCVLGSKTERGKVWMLASILGVSSYTVKNCFKVKTYGFVP